MKKATRKAAMGTLGHVNNAVQGVAGTLIIAEKIKAARKGGSFLPVLGWSILAAFGWCAAAVFPETRPYAFALALGLISIIWTSLDVMWTTSHQTFYGRTVTVWTPWLTVAAIFGLVAWNGQRAKRDASAGLSGQAAARARLVRSALESALALIPDLTAGDQSARIRGKTIVATSTRRVGSKTMRDEFGLTFTVALPAGMTVSRIQSVTGGGFDATDDDVLAATVDAVLRDLGRSADARLAGRIHISGTVAEGHRSPSMARVTIMFRDPFAVIAPHPVNDPAAWIVSVEDFDATTQLPVGVNRYGSIVTCNPFGPHSSWMGASGAGKSTAIHPTLRALAPLEHVAIVICDMKGGGEFRYAAPRATCVESDFERVDRAFRWLLAETVRRNSLSAKTMRTAEHPKIIVVADEFHLYGLPRVPERASKLQYDEALRQAKERMAMVTRLVRTARSAGIHVMLVSQYEKAASLPPELTMQCEAFSARVKTWAQATVATGEQASSNNGPHLIPNDEKWAGVIFGRFSRRTQFARLWWMTDTQKSAAMKAWAHRKIELPGLIEAMNATVLTPPLPPDNAPTTSWAAPSAPSTSPDVADVPGINRSPATGQVVGPLPLHLLPDFVRVAVDHAFTAQTRHPLPKSRAPRAHHVIAALELVAKDPTQNAVARDALRAALAWLNGETETIEGNETEMV